MARIILGQAFVLYGPGLRRVWEQGLGGRSPLKIPQLCYETDFSLGKGMSECKRFFSNSRKLLE